MRKPVWKIFLLGALIGVLSFLVVYGVTPLDPTRVNWIGLGYDEWDIQQRYAGWMAYRNSDWRFPLGDANAWGYPAENGVNIAFSDSVPWVCVLFKLLSPLLPQTFQWEGIYALAGFALQGGAAAMLLSLFLNSWLTTSAATLFFTFSPVLLEREFRHTSLASHYLILFALYFYFKYRRTPGKYPWQMFLLPAVAVGITPYFLPMVAVFILAMCVDQVRLSHKPAGPLLYFLGSCACGIAAAFAIGSVGHGYSAVREQGAYGTYSMNLNAVINPRSCGGYTWSQFLPQREQLYGQYDGFNYLGAGVMAFLALDLLLLLWIAARRPGAGQRLQRALGRNMTVLLVCLFLTVFAVSNVVCFDGAELFTLPLPRPLVALCSVFRASSRLFYPVYYLLMLAAVVVFAKALAIFGKQRFLLAGVVAFAGLQLFDLSGAIVQKHADMDQRAQNSLGLPAELQDLSGYSFLYVTDELVAWGSRNVLCAVYGPGMKTNTWDTNTSPAATGPNWYYMNQTQEQLQQGQYSEDTLYVTIDAARYEQWQRTFADADVRFVTWEVEDPRGPYYFMLPVHSSAE